MRVLMGAHVFLALLLLGTCNTHAQDNFHQNKAKQAFASPSPVDEQLWIKQHDERVLSQSLIHRQASSVRVTQQGQTRDIARFHYKTIIKKSSSLEAFIKEIAPELASISQKTHWEFCGFVSFHEEKKEFTIDITTTKSALFCLPTPYEQNGFASTNAMVHTHPSPTVINATDLELWIIGGTSSMIWLDPEGLSLQDRQHPNTWLITPSLNIIHALPSLLPHSHLSLGILCPFRDLSL